MPTLSRTLPVMALAAGLAASLTVGLTATAARAEGKSAQPQANIVHLSARGSVEVEQDWLTLTLSVTRDGDNAAAVQRSLREITENAMRHLRPSSSGEDMRITTGQFQVFPRYGKNGAILRWQGRSEITLQGRDFPRITQAAAGVQHMTVSNTAFSLSHAAAEELHSRAQSQAVQAFRERARQVTELFGLRTYTLREMTVGSNQHWLHRPASVLRSAPVAMMASSRDEAAPQPDIAVQAGTARVEVEVSGSVVME